MYPKLPSFFRFTPEVSTAIRDHLPIVALEFAVITHGLPYPQNLELARQVEEQVRSQGAVPATTAILNGQVRLGLNDQELEALASPEAQARKISHRDYGIAIARSENGGATVAGTLIAARAAGLRVFSTGGIGGVHRNAPFDVSADLPELARSPLIVVCSGAKSILDLPATTEMLETLGVPILGYQTDRLPAFFSQDSGLPVTARVDSPAEVAAAARAQWELGLQSALLVVVPPPEEVAVPFDQMEQVIQQALQQAKDQGIHGAAMTPFLLDRVNHLTGGASLKANLALLRNNARIAAQIAVALYPKRGMIV